jgi:transposase
MTGPLASDRALERCSSISSVMSRSISCQRPRRTLWPPGGNAPPSVELISRDRGTTFADGATPGAPQALQIAARWHILHTLGEALEKVLARHHTDLKRASTPAEEEQQVIAALDQQALAPVLARSQVEQLRQARRERRLATFTRVHELSAQGWSGASIARMLGIPTKTAGKDAAAEHFPQARRDRGHQLAPSLPFLPMQWTAGEYHIAALSQAIRAPSRRRLANRCAQ